MDLQTRKENLETLNKRLRKKKLMAILLALFSLGVNVFAWFVFSTTAEVKVNGKVASWDVQFRDEEDQLVEEVEIDVDMEPGMMEVVKRYEADNNSEVDVDFTYEVSSLKILGVDVDISSVTDMDTYLRSFYPFSIELSTDKTLVPMGDTGTFIVRVNWDYERANSYYALNEVYQYTDGFLYYKKEGSTYNRFEATSENFASNRSSLYLEKDDADTYFGMKCAEYQSSTGEKCLVLSAIVSITQHNANASSGT